MKTFEKLFKAVIFIGASVLLYGLLAFWNTVVLSKYGGASYEAEAGTNTLTSVSSGQIIKPSHINQFVTALGGDIVPRNVSGVATTNAGSLGSDTYEWLKAWIESGYWVVGDIKMHHTFNGTAESTCGQGWMLADGRVINETNYNTEHGAGSWDTYVGSSPLDGRNLPDMAGKYPIGSATTTQDGTAPITFVGNASNQINIQHSHTVDSHTHDMEHNHLMFDNPVNNGTRTFSGPYSVNTPVNVGTAASTGTHFQIVNGANDATGNWYTSRPRQDDTGGINNYFNDTGSASPGTDNQLSATQDIRPESLEVQYCLRIID